MDSWGGVIDCLIIYYMYNCGVLLISPFMCMCVLILLCLVVSFKKDNHDSSYVYREIKGTAASFPYQVSIYYHKFV